ncbi:DMT family transporter [Acinetobacter soli]|uniref:DMT family transporter n=1 Tax=Acinetobacter soli TaxID=487316 RepID=UPI001ABCBF77|nr:DMT family transporter [Acinetobacter soli]MBO3673096.1 DMT family transporter [Acinetobacter soli]
MKFSMNSVQTGSLCAIFAAFLFSIKAIFIKQAYALSPLVDATTLMVLRMGSALPFFILICWLNRHHNQGIHIKDWLILVFAGLLGYYFASWLDFVGLMFISASLERIILFLYPTLTVLASSLIYRQKLNAKTWFAIFLSYGGTVLVMLQEGKTAPSRGNLWIGCSVVFASAVAFAAYLSLTPHLIKKFGSWNFNGLALSVACVGTLLHFVIGTTHPIDTLMQLPTGVWLYGIGLGFFVTVLPTALLMQSIQRLGASQSAMIASIGPILTIILAVLFLNEHLNLWQWIGCGLNIVGVLMISLGKSRLKH